MGGPEVLGIDGVTLASPAFYATGTPQHPTHPAAVPARHRGLVLRGLVGGRCDGDVLGPGRALGPGGAVESACSASLLVGPRWGPLAALGTALVFPLVHVARSTYSEPVALPVLAAGSSPWCWQPATRPWPRRSAPGPRPSSAGSAHRRRHRHPRRRAARGDPRRPGGGAGPRPATGPRQGPRRRDRRLGGGRVRADLAHVQRVPRQHRRLAPPARRARAWRSCSASGVARGRGRRGLVARDARPGAGCPGCSPAASWSSGCSSPPGRCGRSCASRPPTPGRASSPACRPRQGLPVDGGRTYAEQSLVWMAWWVGPVALVLALVAIAVLAHRAASAWVDGPRPPGVGRRRPSSPSARRCSPSTVRASPPTTRGPTAASSSPCPPS